MTEVELVIVAYTHVLTEVCLYSYVRKTQLLNNRFQGPYKSEKLEYPFRFHVISPLSL